MVLRQTHALATKSAKAVFTSTNYGNLLLRPPSTLTSTLPLTGK